MEILKFIKKKYNKTGIEFRISKIPIP